MTNAETMTIDQLLTLHGNIAVQCYEASDVDSPCFEELYHLEEEIKKRIGK